MIISIRHFVSVTYSEKAEHVPGSMCYSTSHLKERFSDDDYYVYVYSIG